MAEMQEIEETEKATEANLAAARAKVREKAIKKRETEERWFTTAYDIIMKKHLDELHEQVKKDAGIFKIQTNLLKTYDEQLKALSAEPEKNAEKIKKLQSSIAQSKSYVKESSHEDEFKKLEKYGLNLDEVKRKIKELQKIETTTTK